jgi:ketopantoate reductase
MLQEGIPTPVNQTLLRLIRALQHQPSPDPLEETPDPP